MIVFLDTLDPWNRGTELRKHSLRSRFGEKDSRSLFARLIDSRDAGDRSARAFRSTLSESPAASISHRRCSAPVERSSGTSRPRRRNRGAPIRTSNAASVSAESAQTRNPCSTRSSPCSRALPRLSRSGTMTKCLSPWTLSACSSITPPGPRNGCWMSPPHFHLKN